jgi:membrane-bound lytic murein transglycosylase B
MGVTNTAGHPLPQLELASAILVPMGHRGPAFLVYDNFKIIKNWNRSQSYALAVGRLADRVSGAGNLHRALPKVRFSTQDIKQLQSGLQQLGFDAGKPDGIIGPATRDAIRDYQLKTGLVADGFPSEELFAKIRDRG